MKFYKVIHNQKVIDVLNELRYCKFQLKHRIPLLCDKEEAQGILSSDGETCYHTSDLLQFPIDGFPTVTIEEITEQEYKKLKLTECATPQEIAERILLELMERGVM